MSSPPSDLTEVFGAAVERGWDRLVAYVGALVGPHDAEDVAGDAVARAWRRLETFRGEGPIEAWLLRVARTTAIDHLRTRARRPVTSPATDAARAVVGADPAVEVVWDALVADLEVDVREAFVLTQVVGCSYAEAAEIAGVPVGTVRSRVHRARQVLAAAVDAEEDRVRRLA